MSALANLPPQLRLRLESALDSDLLTEGCTITSLRSTLGLREGAEDLLAALRELEGMGISGRGAAAWMRAVDEATSQSQTPDLVWSGPEVAGLHARDTRKVFEELLTSAKQSLWVSAFVFYDGPRVFAPLAQHMETNPGLKVMLLLNIQRKRGDTTSQDDLVRRFATKFWESDWPGTVRPIVYYDPRSLDPDGPAGVLHAKAIVVDRKTVLVTSANLTDAALDRNIELGILERNPALAASVASHFQALIDKKLLIPLLQL